MGIADTNVTAGFGRMGRATRCLALCLAKHFSIDAVMFLLQRKRRSVATKVASVPEAGSFELQFGNARSNQYLRHLLIALGDRDNAVQAQGGFPAVQAVSHYCL